jgi:hypothetical protein
MAIGSVIAALTASAAYDNSIAGPNFDRRRRDRVPRPSPRRIDHWPRARHPVQSETAILCRVKGVIVLKIAAGLLTVVVVAPLATPVVAEEDFPIVGTYTENQPCKGDASDANISRVKITPRDIDSLFGLCTIVNKSRDGNTFAVHVECKGPGGSQMLGDINFTLREDKTIDFSDQDKTYKAVLHRCPD